MRACACNVFVHEYIRSCVNHSHAHTRTHTHTHTHTHTVSMCMRKFRQYVLHMISYHVKYIRPKHDTYMIIIAQLKPIILEHVNMA